MYQDQVASHKRMTKESSTRTLITVIQTIVKIAQQTRVKIAQQTIVTTHQVAIEGTTVSRSYSFIISRRCWCTTYQLHSTISFSRWYPTFPSHFLQAWSARDEIRTTFWYYCSTHQTAHLETAIEIEISDQRFWRATWATMTQLQQTIHQNTTSMQLLEFLTQIQAPIVAPRNSRPRRPTPFW